LGPHKGLVDDCLHLLVVGNGLVPQILVLRGLLGITIEWKFCFQFIKTD
jgi:hypothetical protein